MESTSKPLYSFKVITNFRILQTDIKSGRDLKQENLKLFITKIFHLGRILKFMIHFLVIRRIYSIICNSQQKLHSCDSDRVYSKFATLVITRS